MPNITLTKPQIARLKEGMLLHAEKIGKMLDRQGVPPAMLEQLNLEYEQDSVLMKILGDLYLGIKPSKPEVEYKGGNYNLGGDLPI